MTKDLNNESGQTLINRFKEKSKTSMFARIESTVAWNKPKNFNFNYANHIN